MKSTIQYISFGLAIGCLVSTGCSGSDGEDQNNNAPAPPFVCGDGVITEGYETCEGSDLQGHTCKSLGWEGGVLGCTGYCRYDPSQCTGPDPCGNGVLDPLEGCDGTNMGGWDCASNTYFIGGVLTCNPDCTGNVFQCIPIDTCGDGIEDDWEGCDDGPDNSDTEPNACRSICRRAGCGDGIVDYNETCDDGPANSNILPDACRGNCLKAFCGDGVKDSGEACDGLDLGGETCAGLGFTSGDLLCHTDCTFDASGCQ